MYQQPTRRGLKFVEIFPHAPNQSSWEEKAHLQTKSQGNALTQCSRKKYNP